MIDYKNEDGFVSCWSYSYVKGSDELIGTIREDDEGYFVFHPARKITLCCGQLRRLCEKIAEMNIDK